MSKKTTKFKQTYVVALAKANKFDSGALSRNRDGYYTAGQWTKLFLAVMSVFLSSLVAIVIGALFVNTGLLTLPGEDLFAEWVMLLVSILLFLVGIWWIYFGGKHLLKAWLPLLKDAVGGNLANEEGSVKKDYDDAYYRTAWHRLLDWGFALFTSQDDARDTGEKFGSHESTANLGRERAIPTRRQCGWL